MRKYYCDMCKKEIIEPGYLSNDISRELAGTFTYESYLTPSGRKTDKYDLCSSCAKIIKDTIINNGK